MRVTMLLADHAVVAEGKLYVSGGGWSIKGPAPSPSAIAMKIDVPWDRTNSQMKLLIRLLGEDGEPVLVPGPTGMVPLTIEGEFEVGRPPGLKKGTPIDVPIAFPIGPIPLPPGRYTWELRLDGETQDDWHLAFMVQEMPGQFAEYVVDPPADS